MRVKSQQTRQAILVVGDPMETEEVPEKLELFNELGEPLYLGSGSSRQTASKSTASLAVGATETNTVDLGSSARVWRIVTNRPARIRVYPASAHRDGDLGRSIGSKPPANSGRLLELVTTTAYLDFLLSPEVDMTVLDPATPLFYTSVTNLDSSTGVVTVTYHYFRTE